MGLNRATRNETTPLTIIPFLSLRKKLSVIIKNLFLLGTFGAWQESHTLLGLNTLLLVNTPLNDNPNIPSPIAHRVLQSWITKGIETIGDPNINGKFASFLQLSELFYLSRHNLFKYLQIRHLIRSQSLGSFPNVPEESPLEIQLHDTRLLQRA